MSRIHSLFLLVATFLATTSLDFELDVQVVDNECKEAKPHVPKEYKQNGGNIPVLLRIPNEYRSSHDAQFLLHHFMKYLTDFVMCEATEFVEEDIGGWILRK